MFSFFRRKTKEDKNLAGPKSGKDASKTATLPKRLFKGSDDSKKSPKLVGGKEPVNHQATGNEEDAPEVKQTGTVENLPKSLTLETKTPQKEDPSKNDCDALINPTPFAFSKSVVDSSRHAFFEELLDSNKNGLNNRNFAPDCGTSEPKFHSTNVSVGSPPEAFILNVDRLPATSPVISFNQGSCKLGISSGSEEASAALVNNRNFSVSSEPATHPNPALNCDTSTEERTNPIDSKTIDNYQTSDSFFCTSFSNNSAHSDEKSTYFNCNNSSSLENNVKNQSVQTAPSLVTASPSIEISAFSINLSADVSSEGRLDDLPASDEVGVRAVKKPECDDSSKQGVTHCDTVNVELIHVKTDRSSLSCDKPIPTIPTILIEDSDEMGSATSNQQTTDSPHEKNELSDSIECKKYTRIVSTSDINSDKCAERKKDTDITSSQNDNEVKNGNVNDDSENVGCSRDVSGDVRNGESEQVICDRDVSENVRRDGNVRNGESEQVRCDRDVSEESASVERDGGGVDEESDNAKCLRNVVRGESESAKCDCNGAADGEQSDDSDESDEKSDSHLDDDVFISGTDDEREDGIDQNGDSPNDEKCSSNKGQRLNIVNNKESSVQDRLNELTAELANREAETIQLRYQLEEAQKQIVNKTWGMDRLQGELLSTNQEAESVRDRLRSLENDLNGYQQKDSNYDQDVILKKTDDENGNLYSCSNCDKFERSLQALNRKVRELEEELGNVKRERDKLEEEARSWEAEREQEIKIVQQALHDAEKEKNDIRQRFEKDFELLRTVNTDREQHLLDDFEWKLREVEQACKKRLTKREQVVREQCLEEQIKLKDRLQELEARITLHHSQESELNQLRGLSNEQQRSLKVATRQVEQLQNSEKLFQDEIEKLKSLVQKEKAHSATMQGIHNREVAEKDRKFQFKLDQYKTEVNAQLDEKVQRECARLRIELDRQHKEERRADLEAAKLEMEKELHAKKQNWDRRMQECIKELEILQKKLANKDKDHKQELENVQTVSDRDMMELRRRIDKMDMSYQEKLEAAQEKHDKDVERVVSECEKRIQQSEQQASTARTTLELVKAQHERELEERTAELSGRYERRLQEQWEQLVQEKEEALALIEEHHRCAIDKLQAELDSIYKSQNSHNQRQDSLMHLHQELSITSESSANDEGCQRERTQASEDESGYAQSQEDQLMSLPQIESNKRLDENRERTGNTQVIQTRSSRRKRRSRAQRAASRMNVNFAAS